MTKSKHRRPVRPGLDARRKTLDDLERKPLSTMPESTLLYGYRRMDRPSDPHEAEERPVATVYDESGLLYGEPISEGRGAREGLT
jgi:hypothetical protein